MARRRASGLIVAGIDDLWSRESDPVAALKDACPKTPRIVLAHNPQSVDHFADHRFDLVLSGHKDGINMIEVGAAEISEADMAAAIRFGYDHGIKPLIDLPVGKNLQDHISGRGMVYLINSSVSYVETRFINAPSIARYLVSRKGPLTALSGTEGLAWVKTKYADPK